jgi:hypothetical protein
MQRFDAPAALRDAARAGTIDLGIDHTALVQEYLSPAEGAIVRVEVLDGEYLYAIKIFTDPEEGFNLCPADICQIEAATGESASGPLAASNGSAAACDYGAAAVVVPGPSGDNAGGRPAEGNGSGAPLPAPSAPVAKRPLRIEAYTPPRAIVADAIRLARAGQIDVGGVEYLIAARDGRAYFYDVNALSNFVTDAPSLLGFDPTARLVDFLEARAGIRSAVAV